MILRKGLKKILKIWAWCFASLYASLIRVDGFWHVSIRVSALHGVLGATIREAFYRRTLQYVGEGTSFIHGCIFSYPNVSIGSYVRIGFGTNVGLVDIGDDTRIGPYCSLLSGSHMHGIERTDIPIRLQPGRLQRISVGRDCWLGSHVIVMADIGEGSVIGSGAVVTKPIPPWSIAVGNPAKCIASRRHG